MHILLSCLAWPALRMITDMISTMQENLQAEATKKAYCDAEMGKAAEKKARSNERPVAFTAWIFRVVEIVVLPRGFLKKKETCSATA